MSEAQDYTHTPKTDAELRQIAVDIYHGRIFTDRQVRQPDLLRMIFMPLAFLEAKDVEKFNELQVDMIYEYLDRAGERSVNGCPTFMSMKILTKEETGRLYPIYERYEQLQHEFTQETPA